LYATGTHSRKFKLLTRHNLLTSNVNIGSKLSSSS